MIKLRDAELTDSLPEIVGKQPWAKALSYAISLNVRRILDIADGTRTFSGVDLIDRDDVLDALAIDLRVAQYDRTYSKELKRKLIKYALQYWATAGTKKATQDVVVDVLGEGEITEWYEYGGDPGYFRIIVTDNTLTDDDVRRFKQVAENIKRLSAWLDKLVINMVNDPWTQTVGFIEHNGDNETIKQQRDPNQFYGFFPWEAIYETITQEAE